MADRDQYLWLKRGSLPVFLALSAAYLSATLLRWLRWIVFHDSVIVEGNFEWQPPHALAEVQLILMVVVPACVLTACLYLVTRRHIQRLRGLALLGVAFFLLTTLIDLDMSWFSVSHRHIGLTEVRIFLFENWQKYINVQGAAEERLARRAGVHLAAYSIFVVLATWRPSLERLVPIRIRAYLVALLVVVAVADAVCTNYGIASGNRQIYELSQSHPLRLSLIDGLVARFGAASGLMGEINNALAAAVPDASAVKINPLSEVLPAGSAAGANVMVLAIEGFNVGYFDQLTALDELRKTAIIGADNYSTGDTTHLALLGLTHGTAPFFYGDAHRAQSKYIERFNADGYRTRRFGFEITQYAEIEQYSRNFSLPTVEPPRNDDRAMLDDIARYVRADGRYLALVYYFGTHWPYWHSERFNHFQPEVPFDFEYSRGDLGQYRTNITNRYRNSVDEFNDWLRQFLQLVDLKNTVLVVTGDHGEELLEEGRLTHSGGLWERAIRTPLLIHTPNSQDRTVTSITSHANIMPAVAAAVGVAGGLSRPVHAGSAEQGFAIAGHSNYTSTPTEWVFVSGPYKILFGLNASHHFVIHAVTDKNDRSVVSSALLTDAVFLEALRQMKAVEVDPLPLGSVTG